MRTCTRIAALGLALLGLAACGGGGGSAGGAEPPPAAPTLPLALNGSSVMKLAAAGEGWVALAERPSYLADQIVPERQLLIAQADGRGQPIAYQPPAGWALIDFAVHPASREISLVLAGERQLRLARLDGTGRVLREQGFEDAAAAADPIVGGPFAYQDNSALVPRVTRDAARLEAVGEELLLALRSGRQAVVLYRLAYGAAGGFATRWRSLVEPGVEIAARIPQGGRVDPFKGLDHSWRMALAADPTGAQIAVAVSLSRTELAAGHAAHFGEALPPNLFYGFILSEFDAEGRRLRSLVQDTVQQSELYGLRRVGARWVALGRVRSAATAEGWDGFLAFAASGLPGLQLHRLDVDRGDALFEVQGLPNGELLVAGATGYLQNPGGVSISEEALPLLARLSAEGQLLQRVALTPGPRHNQLRALLPRGQGGWLIGGMENGPGTHSADADPTLLRADGYLRELRF